MALMGSAFLALWHDIEPASQTEYMEWHTREHMPERLSIPGFIAPETTSTNLSIGEAEVSGVSVSAKLLEMRKSANKTVASILQVFR